MRKFSVTGIYAPEMNYMVDTAVYDIRNLKHKMVLANNMKIMRSLRLFPIWLLWLIPFLLNSQQSNCQLEMPEENILIKRFQQQLRIFPQEKIHLHTDKPYYITGERIWFRAHLVDAATHVPSPVSRYVYVELINPLDSVVTRIKIRQEDGVYHGYLPIPENVQAGDYTLRAYTSFMRSLDESYLCTKSIHIGDPQSRTIHTGMQFAFLSRNRVDVTFQFTDVASGAPLVPQSVRISVNNWKPMNVQANDDGTANVHFDLPVTSRQRTLHLTTIHWQPVVQTDSQGVTSFEFYTADEPTTYTVIIEGLTVDGRIIHHERKLWR